jgi:HD-like signal output (HDOD) protein
MQAQDVQAVAAILPTLLERMDQHPGFAAFGASLQVLSDMDDDDAASGPALTAAILRDAGLAARLLRLSNASSRGSRNVSTVDQAVTILGLNTVRSAAQSLVLVDSLPQAQSRKLHAEALAACFCATLASQVTRHNCPRFSAQEAQVCALMQNMGRMMAGFYGHPEIEASRTLQAEQNLAEDEAVALTLGTSFEQLGAGIAQAWNWSDVLQQCLSASFEKSPPKAAVTAPGWYQHCSLFARRITDILFRLPEAAQEHAVERALDYFRTALFLKNEEVHEWIARALADTDALMAQTGFPCSLAQARALLRKGSERVLDALSAQDSLTRKQGDGARSPIDTIHQALRMLHFEFDFDLSLLLVPDGAVAAVAICGIGRNAGQVTPNFRCHGARPDLFRLLMGKKADMFVPEAQSAAFSKLLPDWYPGLVGAHSFQVVSLVHEGKLLGMLYGDYTEARAALPVEKQEGNARHWRDAILAALNTGN